MLDVAGVGRGSKYPLTMMVIKIDTGPPVLDFIQNGVIQNRSNQINKIIRGCD